MGAFRRLSLKIFGGMATSLTYYFPEIKIDLKKARMKYTFQEYLSIAMFTSIFLILVFVPVFTILFNYVFNRSLFSRTNLLFPIVTAITVSVFLSVIIFFLFLAYPKSVNRGRAKKIDAILPFASLYLSSLANSKLPLPKFFDIFSKFTGFGELSREMNAIDNDIKTFGMDINSAIEREIERTPSKNLKELLWGILSTSRTGGDLSNFLKEKSKNYIAEYRRKIFEFSHQLTFFMELYIVALLLGAFFFTVLTAIFSGLQVAGNAIMIQFFIIFGFIPFLSVIFILMIKSSQPGVE